MGTGGMAYLGVHESVGVKHSPSLEQKSEKEKSKVHRILPCVIIPPTMHVSAFIVTMKTAQRIPAMRKQLKAGKYV